MTYHTIYRHGSDYAAYALPVSMGGKGPENADEVLGIECDHHYGITTHDLVEGETPAQTVYRLVRELWHPFRPEHSTNVTDDNHTWKVEESFEDYHHGRVILYKNEKSPPFFSLPGLRWYDDGPGARWFDQSFRVVTFGVLAAEAANALKRADEYLIEAAAQKDTIKGRKAASKLQSYAQSARYFATGAIAARWPQHFVAEAA